MNYSVQMEQDLDLALALGLMIGFTLLGVLLNLVVAILIYLPYRNLPPEHRKMPPEQVFLLLIPLFNIVWNFFVFTRVPQSFAGFYRSRGRHDVGDAGRLIGMWYAICVTCTMIPCINALAGPAALVLLVIFLVKIWQLARPVPELAAQPPATPSTTPPTVPPISPQG